MRHYKRLLLLPAILSVAALITIAVWGLKPGIDLAGGSLLQVTYASSTPTSVQVQSAIAPLSLGEVRIQPAGTSGFILNARDLSNDEKNSLEGALTKLGSLHEDQFNSIGPSIGQELLHKGLIALALVALCVVLFIAFALRKVSRPVSSWKFGLIAIITLLHDILIPVGLFAFLGHVRGAEVDSLFIVALLTLLGVSINNTIVVFDRIRENLRINQEKGGKEAFGDTVGRSIMQTLARSINTSLTVVIVLLALLYLGPATTHDFALTLLVGMIVGAYSSIFLAAPLLVWTERLQKAQ